MTNFEILKQRARQNEKAKSYLDGLTNTLAKNIFKLRLEKKITQSQLAELAGVTQKTIYRIESGDPGVKVGTYEKVLNALSIENYEFQVENNSGVLVGSC